MPESKMGAEWFDVVDGKDVVASRATRQEVHARGLRHRAVHVLVFNRAGELFLQKRSARKDTAPGAWDSSVSGHVDAGEDYDASAVRELSEEIGLQAVRAPRRWLRLAACPETGQEFVWVYRLEAEGPFSLHPEEIERGAWFTPAEITRLLHQRPADYASAFRLIWQKLQERGEAPR
jgi:isopentenyldiphosphate isomerase